MEGLAALGGPERPSAEHAYPDVFEHLDAIASEVQSWLPADTTQDSGTVLQQLQLTFISRALHQYRAVILMLRNDHWVDAWILTRSMFELVLNVEELMHRARNKEEAARRFYAFCYLQELLEKLDVRRHRSELGIPKPGDDAATLDAFERDLRKTFAIFAYKDKKGRPRWREHWANRNVAEMSRLSRNRMRMYQHRLAYRKGSAFTHSAPRAVLAAYAPPPESVLGRTRAANYENVNVREAAGLAALYLGDVLYLVGERLPQFKPEWYATILIPATEAILAGPAPRA